MSSPCSSPSPSQDQLKQQGNIHVQKKEYSKAIDFYTQAIILDPAGDATAPILSNRSMCYFHLGKYKDAYEDAGCCCGIRPDWAKGFARRAVAAEKLREYEIAYESFNEYLKLNDNKDEIDAKQSSENMKIILDEIAAEKKKDEVNAVKLKKYFESISDPDERQAKATAQLLESAKNLKLEEMKVAVKVGGARLDNISPPGVSWYDWRSYTKTNLEKARRIWDNKDNNKDGKEGSSSTTEVGSLFCVAQHLIQPLNTSDPNAAALAKDTAVFSKTTRNRDLIKYLDLLYDFAEAEENYSPIYGSTSLMQLCSFSNAHADTSLSRDILLTIINRGSVLFDGKKINNTDSRGSSSKIDVKENELFMTRLLQEVLIDRAAVVGEHSSFNYGSDTNSKDKKAKHDSFSQDLYEVLLSLINAGAKCNYVDLDVEEMKSAAMKNKKNKKEQQQDDVIKFPTLTHAVRSTRSAKIVQLLLRHGASVNEEIHSNSLSGGEATNSTPLSAAFKVRSLECVRVLIDYGAKLRVSKTPKWIIDAASSLSDVNKTAVFSDFSSLVKVNYSETLLDFFDIHDGESSAFDSNPASRDLIRLLFEKCVEQDLSFLCPFQQQDANALEGNSNNNSNQQQQAFSARSPLCEAIRKRCSPGIVDLIASLNPLLMKVPSLEKDKDASSPIGYLLKVFANYDQFLSPSPFQLFKQLGIVLVKHGARDPENEVGALISWEKGTFLRCGQSMQKLDVKKHRNLHALYKHVCEEATKMKNEGEGEKSEEMQE